MSSAMIALCLAASFMSPAPVARPEGGGGGNPSGTYALPYFNDAQDVVQSGWDNLTASELYSNLEGDDTSDLKMYGNNNGHTTSMTNGVFGSITVLANELPNLPQSSGNGFFSHDHLWGRTAVRGQESISRNTKSVLTNVYGSTPNIAYYQYIYTFNIKYTDGFHSGMVGGPGFSYNP
jgi:hypothetical protein